jgi:hypothetical protein
MLLYYLTITSRSYAVESEERCVSMLNEFDSVISNFGAVVLTRLLRFVERVDLIKSRNGDSIRRKTLTFIELGLKLLLLLQCLSLLHCMFIVNINFVFLVFKFVASCLKSLCWWKIQTILVVKWNYSMNLWFSCDIRSLVCSYLLIYSIS